MESERSRSLEYDALRLLVLISEMGQDGADDQRFIDGERQLQTLDHLMLGEGDLASVLIDRVREDGRIQADLAVPVRRLLGRHRRGRLEATSNSSSLLHQPRLWTWQRLDDRLSFLACRQLLRTRIVRSSTGEARTRYLLSERGARLVENDLRQLPVFSACCERCAWLRAVLINWPNVDLGILLQEVSERFLTLREDEQIAAEDDLVAFLFPSTFGEPL